MFNIADNFFQSLGMKKMTDQFWNNSILEKPKDIKMVWYVINNYLKINFD